ncbi:NUDIX domain-containing protein [Histidinibacterium lentulum]|uniref:NUDIX domain-containing protein n=1 Tax=Histidinibacterium lentulum TaxID=2480588 RepID=UPI00160AD30C|nr:NUDIX domain-containing protein [Histidinibacterium lentulum]
MRAVAFEGAKGLVLLGDRALVLLRDEGVPWAGMWDLPGGGREGAESPWETLGREVEEEVGLGIDGAEVLWRHRGESAVRPGAVVWFFVLRLGEGAVRELLFGEEGTAWALMAPAKVMGLERLVPAHRPRLERYLALAGAWGRPVAEEAWDAV